MSGIMYDSVDLNTVPLDATAVAGYVGGSWPTWYNIHARFPHAHALSIAPQAYMNARCLDVEPGDASNAQAPNWFRNHADHSHGLPVLYTSASNVQALIDTMTAASFQRNQYLVWSAHYNFSQHICASNGCGYPQADATQWTDRSIGRNLDESLVSDNFFGPPLPHPANKHYDRFPAGHFPYRNFSHKTELLNERDIVERYDVAIQHPAKHGLLIHGLRVRMLFLRNRCKYMAYHQPGPADWGPFPQWGVNWLGWRWQELNKRLH